MLATGSGVDWSCARVAGVGEVFLYPSGADVSLHDLVDEVSIGGAGKEEEGDLEAWMGEVYLVVLGP